VRIIYTYLFKELVTVSLATTGVLTFLLVLVNAFKDIFDKLLNTAVPLTVILKLVVLLIPFVLTFTLPWGVLLAVLIVFGRLSQDKELLALKASGIGLLPIIAPAIWLGALGSVISFWINASLGPLSRQAFKQIGYEMISSDPMAMFKARETLTKLPNRLLWFDSKEGTTIRNVVMWELDKDRIPIRAVRADKGVIQADFQASRLIVTLHNARMEERDRQNPNDINAIRPAGRFEQLPIEISLDAIFQADTKPRITNETMGDLLGLLTDPKGMLLLDNPTPALTELQKRIALSLSCLTFVLVGIPLAIQAQRSETSVGVAISLVVVLVYYFIMITAEAMKKYSAVYPELIIWLPNVLFQGLGIYLIARVNYRK
jgi:lipopolysaccharide export system permease protein